SLTALQLVKACFSGPQDLYLADAAIDRSAHLWTKLGGTASLLHSLQWIWALRPARFVLSVLHGRGAVPAALTAAARPLGAVGDVIQIAARSGSCDRVLQRLVADAWRHGAAALRGRLDPRHVQEFSDPRCWLRTGGSWTLVHSRHAEILAAIRQGDAFLSRL